MASDLPQTGFVQALRDNFDFRHAKLEFHGPVQLGGWTVGAAGATRQGPPCTVPTPSATFVPRHDITSLIHATLNHDPDTSMVRQAVVRAYGGYGKTVAAILYANAYKDAYPGGRFFLPMEHADIVQSLASLAPPLGLPATTDPFADAKVVKQHLESSEPSLVILDNVVNNAAWQAMLDSGLVPRGNCRVLITTRDEAISLGDDIAIGRLEPSEAREIFRLFCEHRRKKPGDAEPLPQNVVADEITAWVGGLAVAVAAIAARMKLMPHVSWEHAWRGDGKKLRGLKNTPVAELPDARLDVREKVGLSGASLEEHRRTLRVIDDALDALPPAERRAVEYAALLPADLAPAIWLESLVESDVARPELLEDGSPDPLRLAFVADPDDPQSAAQAVLRHLDDLDVILPGGEGGKLLSLHRLWHARINERWAESGTDLFPYLLAVTVCASFRARFLITGSDNSGDVNSPATLTDASLRWELTPLVALCTGLWARGEPGAACCVGIFLGQPLRLLGRLAEASECLTPVAEYEADFVETLGMELLSESYSNLAMIRHDQGRLPEALSGMLRALDIHKQVFPPDHLSFAPKLTNLSWIQRATGDLPAARISAESAVKIAQAHRDAEPLLYATCCSNLGGILQSLGENLAARTHVANAVEIIESTLGPDHPTLATTLSNLSWILKELRELSESVQCVRRSIRIGEVHLGPDHPSLAVYHSNLSGAQASLGDLAGAQESVERAIRINQHHFGSTHPDLSTLYSNLAIIQKDRNLLDGALGSIHLAIDIDRLHFGPDHPTHGLHSNNLASILHARGDLDAASIHYKAALTNLRKTFKDDHPQIVTLMNSMQGVTNI